MIDDKNKAKLKKIAEEILETEKAYLARLNLIEIEFRRFLIEKSKQLNEKNYPTVKQIDSIFLNVNSIYDFHSILLPMLESSVHDWDRQERIGTVFIKLAPFIKLYSVYISGFQNTQELLMNLTKKFPKFLADIEMKQNLPQCQKLTLTHHMLEPIQRVPRYKLLLTEYLKYLPERHKDYDDCSKSLQLVVQSADHANNRVKEFEFSNKLMEIQNNIIGDVQIIIPGRKLIKSGDINVVSNKKIKPAYIYLFNDVLLECVPSSNKKNKLKHMYELINSSINRCRDLTDNFFIKSQSVGLVIFNVNDQTEREDWFSKIEDMISLCKERIATLKLESKDRTESCSGSLNGSRSNISQNSKTQHLEKAYSQVIAGINCRGDRSISDSEMWQKTDSNRNTKLSKLKESSERISKNMINVTGTRTTLKKYFPLIEGQYCINLYSKNVPSAFLIYTMERILLIFSDKTCSFLLAEFDLGSSKSNLLCKTTPTANKLEILDTTNGSTSSKVPVLEIEFVARGNFNKWNKYISGPLNE